MLGGAIKGGSAHALGSRGLCAKKGVRLSVAGGLRGPGAVVVFVGVPGYPSGACLTSFGFLSARGCARLWPREVARAVLGLRSPPPSCTKGSGRIRGFSGRKSVPRLALTMSKASRWWWVCLETKVALFSPLNVFPGADFGLALCSPC